MNLNNEKYFKIYDLVPTLKHHNAYNLERRQSPPFDIDYKTGLEIRLQPKIYMEKGEVYKIEYYKSIDENGDFQNLIVFEEISYNRDLLGFAKSRVINISWLLNDETISTDKKTLSKVYSNLESVEEGVKRRGNIIKNIEIEIVGLISTFDEISLPDALIVGRNFSAKYKPLIDLFVNQSIKDIKTALLNDDEYTFLNGVFPDTMTVREYLIEQFNI